MNIHYPRLGCILVADRKNIFMRLLPFENYSYVCMWLYHWILGKQLWLSYMVSGGFEIRVEIMQKFFNDDKCEMKIYVFFLVLVVNSEIVGK